MSSWMRAAAFGPLATELTLPGRGLHSEQAAHGYSDLLGVAAVFMACGTGF